MATIGQTCGMEILAWSQNLTEKWAAAGAVLVPEDEFLARADEVIE